jgi:chorismate synthase
MNSFGQIFRITSFGESHGPGIGVVVDGCPAGLRLDTSAIQEQLDRRRPGQNRISSQRLEGDRFEMLSGTVGGITSGAPLAFFVRNEDHRSRDYEHLRQIFRPSHADYSYFAKYGLRDAKGGGRSSARETIARVIGGAVAQQLLGESCGMRFQAWVSAIGEIEWSGRPHARQFPEGHQEWVRCPDQTVADHMVQDIEKARKEGDSLGGVISCAISNVPTGLGEPVYGKLNALLGFAMLSINAVKGFELGSGFTGARMRGSEHNDLFYGDKGQIRTVTNHSGGVQGGISNGEEIFFRVAFKPTSTIIRDQQSVDEQGEAAIAGGKGRHDPCVVPRAVPIVESMAALVMADLYLLQKTRRMDSLG